MNQNQEATKLIADALAKTKGFIAFLNHQVAADQHSTACTGCRNPLNFAPVAKLTGQKICGSCKQLWHDSCMANAILGGVCPTCQGPLLPKPTTMTPQQGGHEGVIMFRDDVISMEKTLKELQALLHPVPAPAAPVPDAAAIPDAPAEIVFGMPVAPGEDLLFARPILQTRKRGIEEAADAPPLKEAKLEEPSRTEPDPDEFDLNADPAVEPAKAVVVIETRQPANGVVIPLSFFGKPVDPKTGDLAEVVVEPSKPTDQEIEIQDNENREEDEDRSDESSTETEETTKKKAKAPEAESDPSDSEDEVKIDKWGNDYILIGDKRMCYCFDEDLAATCSTCKRFLKSKETGTQSKPGSCQKKPEQIIVRRENQPKKKSKKQRKEKKEKKAKKEKKGKKSKKEDSSQE
jgi:hypothetical protein